MAGKNNQGYRNPFVTTGGTYENPRLGITDFGGFSEEFEGRTKLAVEKHELKKADWRAKYNAGKLSAEELYGGEAIGGTDTENITESGIALEGNQALMDQFQETLQKNKAEFAYYAASGNTVETNKILKDNELYKNAFTGAQAYAAATNDTGVDGTYNAGASDDNFDSHEEGMAGVEMEAYMVIHNKNKADMKFEKVTNSDGTEVVGTYVDYPQDENGNYLAVADGGKVTKRFIDFSKWNDETYVATKYKANVDIDKNITDAQKDKIDKIEFENTTQQVNSGDPGFQELVVDGVNVIWTDKDDHSKGKTQIIKTEKVSQKSIDGIRSKVDEQTNVVFNKNNSAQFPAIYDTMINTDGYVPGDEDTIPGAVENDIFSFIKDNQLKLNYMTGDQKNAYQDLLIKNNALKDFDTWSSGKDGLTDIKKRSKYNEYVSGKMDEYNTWFMQDYYKQKSLANTGAFNLNENGRAIAVGSTTDIEEKYETKTPGTSVSIQLNDPADPNIPNPNLLSNTIGMFSTSADAEFFGRGSAPKPGSGEWVEFKGVDLADPETIKGLGDSLNQMFGGMNGQLLTTKKAKEAFIIEYLADTEFNIINTELTTTMGPAGYTITHEGGRRAESYDELTDDQKQQIELKWKKHMKLRPGADLVYVDNMNKSSERIVPLDNLEAGEGYYSDVVEFYTHTLEGGATTASAKYKKAINDQYHGNPGEGIPPSWMKIRDIRVKTAVNFIPKKGEKFDTNNLTKMMEFFTIEGELDKNAFEQEMNSVNVLRRKKGLVPIGFPADWDDE